MSSSDPTTSSERSPVITLRPADERGRVDHGWLDARHSFSFASYHDPRWMHFGPLRVLNEDRVAPGQGFGLHGHQDMEIVTWILEGALEHRDSLGNGSVLRPGDVQVMSAGTGVQHSEFNASSSEPVHLLQMWVLPERTGARPTYAERHVPVEERTGRLALLASPDGADGSLPIGRDVRLGTALLAAGNALRQPLVGSRAWLQIAKGRVRCGELELAAGDGAGFEQTTELTLHGVEDAEVLLWDMD